MDRPTRKVERTSFCFTKESDEGRPRKPRLNMGENQKNREIKRGRREREINRGNIYTEGI